MVRKMSIEALQTAEVQVENVADLAQFIAAAGASQGQQIVQVSDVTAPILQVQDAIANGTIIQVSEAAVAPLVQVTDQTQGGVFITDGLANGIQILDGSFPLIQGTDGNIIQLAQPVMSGGSTEGLTQVVQFANGQIALIEQQENIDPQSIQHLVFEQIPPQQVVQAVEEASQGVQTETRAPSVRAEIQPPVGKGPYKCETCEKVFPKWNQLQRHIRHHEEDKPHQCIHCPASFNIIENLKLHEATHVEEGQRPQCPECSKKFSRVASLKAHIMLHEREESLMCAECGDEFALQAQLDRHLKEHRDSEMGQKTYPCRQCIQEFTKPAQLKEHMKQHYKIKSSLSHKTYKKVIDRSGFNQKCPHCMKSFQKPSQLERHIRVHTGEKPYKCTTCTKAFNQKGALQIHMSKHTGVRSHNCQFCTQTFAQKGNLRAHIQRVHTLSEDSTDGSVFHCDQCSCVFKKLGSLNAHISRFHTEHSDLPTQVDMKKDKDTSFDKTGADVIQHLLELSEAGGASNGQKLAQPGTQDVKSVQQGGSESDILQQALVNSGLPGSEKKKEQVSSIQLMNVRDSATGIVKKHVIRKIGGVRWHQCTYCTKEFKKPSDLVRHIRIHSHEKPYKCNQCFRAFAVKSTLTAHIRTHTGIKHYKCNVCDKLFSTHSSLKVHSRLHTGAKPFECAHCDKKFRTAAHKKSHVMQHFKDYKDGKAARERVRDRRQRLKTGMMSADVPLQEPILITDTGLIQQPPRNNLLNQYLGDSHSVDRPYKCTYCQRGFKKSSHLKQHVRSHTGEKPYKCQQCGRTFVSNGVLKAHVRIHTGVKHYKCLLCETLFTTNGSLKRHMSTHSEVRPFMCPYCQKTFKTSVNCKKHMKTHRHELAFQSSMEQQEGIQLHPTQDPIQTLDHEETHPETEETSFVTEAAQNDLDLVQQDLNPTSMMSQQDLTQQSILSQANLQDALGLGTTGLELQQTLNQQIFGQQQTFNQSLLGTGQQNFQPINNQMNSINQTQYSVQSSGMTQLDINSMTNQAFTTEPVGQDIQTLTNMTNISTNQPSEEDHAVQQISSVTEMPGATMQNILQSHADDEIVDNDDEDDGEDTGAPTEHVIARDTTRKYHCQYCDKSFKKSSHLKQHVRSHTGEKPYRCAVCSRTFVSVGVLRAHLRTHSGVKEFKCNLCNTMFSTNGSLTRHMNNHISRKPIKCTYCEATFRNLNFLKKHEKSHIPEDAATDNQPESVPAGSIQYIHAGNGQINPGPPPDTALSEKILIESASEKDRISDVRSLQGVKGEKHPNQCPNCVKSFKKPSDLVRHIRIHTGEKPYACQICGRTFTVKSTLDSHMKTHGGIDKTIKCHICSSMFSTKGSLKVHMRLHTGAKPFRCPHCSQRFRTSGHRKSHILSHYKPETSSRKRRSQNSAAQEQTAMDTTQENFSFLNNVEMPNNMVQQNQGQVINIDPALLQGSNIMPLSLTVDNFGNITDGSQATQILQGTDGIQLQVTGVNLPQGVQIAGLDPNMFQQTVQIDANLLQQLQNGNVNITLNPNQMDGQTITAADPNLVQNIQIQQLPLQEPVNPNIVVQHPTMGQVNVNQAPSQPDVAPNSFVVAADGSFPPEQQIGQPQVAEILTPQPAPVAEIQTNINTNLPDNTQQSVNITTAAITTGNTELANTASNIEQTRPNEMDTIDPNITQNVASMTADMDAEGDNEDDLDSDDEDDVDVNDTSANQENDAANMEMVHESVDESIHEGQESFEQFDGVAEMPPSTLQMLSDRTHRCQICNKSFKRAGHLREHVQIHEQKYRRDKPTPHRCSHCNKCFQKPSQLERHVRIHTGERPFACKLCEKSFNQKNALQIHLKKHSGDKPHKCTYCDNAFTQKGNLKTHIKRAHHIDMVQSMKLPQGSQEYVQTTSDTTANSHPDETLNLEEVADLF